MISLISIGALIASFSQTMIGVSAMSQPEPISLNEYITAEAIKYDQDPYIVHSIIQCESQGDYKAINYNKNGSIDKGLLQINSIHNTEGLDLLNPKDNLEFGLKLMKEKGTEPWKYSKHCWS